MAIFLWIILGVVILIILWLIVTYNGLIRSKNQTDEAWSDIDVQLKRRYDLIPNLIETVKGFTKQESSVLQNVTEARTKAMNAGSPKAKGEAENMLTSTLKTLFAVSENYPELKSNENFGKLQDELSDTENKIQASRRFYNSNVRDYNTKLEVFPTNMIAKALGFSQREFFEIEAEEERKNVSVKF